MAMNTRPPHDQIAFDFGGNLLWSKGKQSDDVPELISNMLDGVVDVVRADGEDDRHGTDWWVTLRGGAKISIDEKRRDQGCSKYWNSMELFGDEGIELAPEIWSIMPWDEVVKSGWAEKREWNKADYANEATGWTLNESKETDYIFCIYDPSDTETVVLLPFQQYRTAFRRFLPNWKHNFRVADQPNEFRGRCWLSQCVFVPLWCVLDAIRTISVMSSRPPPPVGEDLTTLGDTTWNMNHGFTRIPKR